MKRPAIRYLLLTALIAVLFISGCDSEQVPMTKMSMPSSRPTTTAPRMPSVAPPPPTDPIDVNITTRVTPTTLDIVIGPPSTTLNNSTSPTHVTTPLPQVPVVPDPTHHTPADHVVLAGQVTNISAQAVGTREITLAWSYSGMENPKCYNVYRSTKVDGPYEWVFSPGTPSYLDVELEQSVTYYYCIQAVDSADNVSEKSKAVAVTTITPVVLELFGQNSCPHCPFAERATAILAKEFGSKLITLEYNISNSRDAQNAFGNYGLTGTPWAVFNGGSLIAGGSKDDATYTKYKNQITSLLDKQRTQPSSASLHGSVVNANNRFRVDVTLTNSSETLSLNASLYAVIYERVYIDARSHEGVYIEGSWHNMVRGVTAADIVGLDAGTSANYQLRHNDLSYNNNYGVVAILKAPSGQIIQAYQIK